ncbi:serine protease grass-like [Teleopsis dalmanni]|uniref:serine protease grass-like n=1 Tax=Teleopsis dalmanni TaxID=139649 RepID=UPI0018CD3466|nr:serine protease grass-like [Teleopsis dalmanni]
MRSNMFRNIFTVGSLLITLSSITFAQQSCFTPSGSYGNCVPIRSCVKVVNELSRLGENTPQSYREHLIQSRCNTSDDIHICCDSNDDDYEKSLNPNGLQILNDLKCGTTIGDRLAFGERAKLGEFPWMALIKYDTVEKPYKCGGSLISHRHVLSAAHCLVVDFNIVGVRLGEYDLNTDPDCQRKGRRTVCMPPVVDYGIEKVLAHPHYSRQALINDVGLIKLDRDVEFNKHIKPICLPITKRTAETDREQYFITGWGTTENGTTASVLMKGTVKHQELKFCQDLFKRVRITDNHLCVGGEGRIDTCKGDSGGPLFFLAPYKTLNRYVQFGVVSFGVAACGLQQALPGVYADIIPQMPWITANLD